MPLTAQTTLPLLLNNRFASNSDVDDVYLVTLEAGQSISMFVGDAEAALSPGDLDLYLYSVNDTTSPVDTSINTTAFESVTAPAQGSYFVLVTADSGVSNYVLFVTNAPFSPANYTTNKLNVLDDFIPGEFIVQFKSSVNSLQSPKDSIQNKFRSLGLNVKAGGDNRHALLRTKDVTQVLQTLGVTNNRTQSLLAAQTPDLKQKSETIKILKGIA